jgi:small subunit ribosomal protein S6
MPLYETVFIARNDITQQQVEAIVDGIGSQLDADKGIAPPPPPAEGEVVEGPRPSVSLKKREYWGLRSLAYRINKNRKGHYMLLGIDAAPASVLEMERQLRLNEDVLRFMTIRVDAIEEAQSAILSRKADDRERGFRGPKPAGRFESGRKRGYEDREEFRARDDVVLRDRDEFHPPEE